MQQVNNNLVEKLSVAAFYFRLFKIIVMFSICCLNIISFEVSRILINFAIGLNHDFMKRELVAILMICFLFQAY